MQCVVYFPAHEKFPIFSVDIILNEVDYFWPFAANFELVVFVCLNILLPADLTIPAWKLAHFSQNF